MRAEQTVRAFLKAQSARDLEAMCGLCADDIVYQNEPLPASKQIAGLEQFRQFFGSSPCIWCDQAELRELRLAADEVNGVVLTERLDRFYIDGQWLEIPICGAFDVVDGRIQRWKDYWDYQSYARRKERLFGPGFSLFRQPEPAPAARWVVICSPVSGSGQAAQVVQSELMPAWSCDAPALTVVHTEHHGHAMALAEHWGSADCGLIAVGGDGTIHEVLQGLQNKGVLQCTPVNPEHTYV